MRRSNSQRDAALAIAEVHAELTGQEHPLADMSTKVITLRLHEHDVFSAEVLAAFGNKKRAAILKAAVSIGLDSIFAAFTEEELAKAEAIEIDLLKAGMLVDDAKESD